MRKMVVMLTVVGVAVLAMPQVYAICGASTPMVDLSSSFTCKNTDPKTGALVTVAAMAWQITGPTTANTGTEVIDNNLGGPGNVSIQTDWGNAGITGCPVLAPGAVGCPAGGNPCPQRIALVVQAADGTGALITVSGTTSELGYAPDAAHPIDALGNEQPIPCDTSAGRPTITNASSTSLALHFTAPRIYSDCDPTSVGQAGITAINPCLDQFNPAITLGKIYTSVQACGVQPDIRRSSWTASAVVPNATGDAVVPITQPTTAGSCIFVGSTMNLAGNESGAITGFVQVAGTLAAAPHALDVQAVQAGGNVKIAFRTDTQVGLAAINIMVEGKKGLEKISTIAPKAGDAGTSYSVSVARGAFKSARSVVVQTVTADGKTFNSAAARF